MRIAFSFLALVAPATALVLSIPLALTPLSGDPRGFFGPYLLVALPSYGGALAAPEYLYALLLRKEAATTSSGTRLWVRVSLALAGIASSLGVVGSVMMVLFAPPALVSLLCVAVVWFKFERGWNVSLDSAPTRSSIRSRPRS